MRLEVHLNQGKRHTSIYAVHRDLTDTGIRRTTISEKPGWRVVVDRFTARNGDEFDALTDKERPILPWMEEHVGEPPEQVLDVRAEDPRVAGPLKLDL